MSYNTYPQNPFPPNSENAGGGSFTLPIASISVLGGVKVGSGLSINAETGVLTPSNDVIRENDIALPFDANSSYLAGDFCYYNGTLYRCETDHSGAWDANDFFAVRVCDSIISEFGDGLQRMSNSIYVKLERGGGLSFNENGELKASGEISVNQISVSFDSTGRGVTNIPIATNDIISAYATTLQAIILPFWGNDGYFHLKALESADMSALTSFTATIRVFYKTK